MIGDEQEGLPVEAISLVHDPAIEELWVAFSKGAATRMVTLATVDEDKRTLIGAALIPDKHIVRYDGDEEYDVFFSAETVKKASELYMMHSRTNEHTLEHQTAVDGVHVVESWIVENPDMDKSKAYGFSMPEGTWMVRVHVANDEMWEKVKAGEIRGFSIEGYFIDSVVQARRAKKSKQELSMKDKLWQTVKGLFRRNQFYTEISLEDGTVIATEDEAMGAGSTVKMIDAEGMPVEMKNGKYRTQAGVELEVYDGVLIEYDGEVSAVEETQGEAENDEKVELNADKVRFYKAYMKARMRREFGYFQH
jgi:hypothetical protein